MKWIGTTVVGIASAIAGATVVGRIGSAAPDHLLVCIAITSAAFAAIVFAAWLCAWAVTAPDPALRELLPVFAGQASTTKQSTRKARRLARELDSIGPVASFKYSNLSEIAEQLQRLGLERSDAFKESIRPGLAANGWKETLGELDAALGTVYVELDEVATQVKFIRTEHRARIALPIVAALCLISVLAMIPIALLTEPRRELSSAISESTYVDFQFQASPRIAIGDKGCIPPRAGSAYAVGGTWVRPVMMFEATRSNGDCKKATIWLWEPADDLQIVILAR